MDQTKTALLSKMADVITVACHGVQFFYLKKNNSIKYTYKGAENVNFH